MARSTLELLLDSIKEREQEPPDLLPVLPQRPTSRARLPSRKRTSALLLSDPSLGQPNGHTRHQAHASDSSTGSFPYHSNGRRFDGQDEVSAGCMHVHDEASSQAVQNGGDQMKTMSRSNHEGFPGADESTLLSRKRETSYTSLKKRRRNHHVQSLQKDARVWLLNQEEKWTLGVIQSADDLGSVVCMADGQLFRILPEKLLPANPELLDGVDVLEQLSYIHDPAIFHNLQCRYQLGNFCTRAGASLIAFTPPKGNPYGKQLSQSSLEALKLKVKHSKQPHVHTIANNALDGLKRDWKHQSIILSGESGAGKTESAKSVLQHLMSCGGNRGGNRELGNALLLIDSVLEAFGNANVSNSANASRFGKVMNINFDKSGKFCSASCQIVFFEKSRVVCRAERERSYHIFYQLCEGADPFLREKLNLRGAMEFDYLKNSGVNGVNEADHSGFQALLNDLYTLGFSEKVQQEIFSLLAAVLWLGNIGTDARDIKNEAVDNAAKLLKCSRKDLLGAIGFGYLNPDDVLAARDVLACSIYERLFYWLVAQVNKLLKPKEACDVKSISVVDLPGFGFSKNIEGLLVNYAHEHLQQFIQWHLLQQEEEAVTCGGLSSLVTNSSRDDDTIDYLEHELIPLLIDEEAGALSEGAESRFMRRLEKLLAGSSCCKQLQSKELTVSHCFGEVTYNVSSFSKEVKVAVSCQASQILHSCMMDLLEISTTEDNVSSRKSFSQDSLFQKASLSTGQEQVLQMMQQLDNTAPHFIFCIAPNEEKLTQSLQQEYVLRQLHISKVVEAVRIYKSGYSTSISHELFASRFGILLGPDAKVVHNALGVCVEVLQRLDVPSHMYKVGLTKLFLPPEQVQKLEDAREQFLQKVVGIQKTYRGYRIRSQLWRQKKAATHLQALVRGWLVRRGYTHHYAEKVEVERSSVHENKVESQPSTEMKSKAMGSCKAISSDGDNLIDKEDETCMSPGLVNKSKGEGNLSKRENSLVQVKNRNGELDEKRLALTASGEARMQTTAAEVLLQKKEEEITLLQQSLKEYERKYLAYKSKMKSMEEMRQKQIVSLEQRLSVATKGSNADEPANKTADSDYSAVRSTTPLVASARDTPETTPGDPDLTVGRGELDSGRCVLDNLSKELEHRTQVFNDDAKFLVEVKSGQIEVNFKPDEELRKLRQRFDVWKKDYKSRLKETKGILKKLGKSDPAEKSKKKWWSRN